MELLILTCKQIWAMLRRRRLQSTFTMSGVLGLLTHCVKKANIGKKAIALKAGRYTIALTHALQNDSVKVIIKMDDALTQSQTVQIYLDIT